MHTLQNVFSAAIPVVVADVRMPERTNSVVATNDYATTNAAHDDANSHNDSPFVHGASITSTAAHADDTAARAVCTSRPALTGQEV